MEAFLSTEFAEKLKSEAIARPEDSNKGSFGRILAICGSCGMAGAAYFSALASYRTGAGLVEIFTPEDNRCVLQTLIPEAIINTYDSECFDPYLLAGSIDKCDALLIGPELGMSRVSLEILKTVLRQTRVPTVIDADALNLLAEHKYLLKSAAGSIITPHLKEMSRLTGIPVEDIQKDTQRTSLEFAKKYSLTCVLKSHNTAVCDKGGDTYINALSNSALATAGSGDVLAGIITSLLAQKHLSLSNFEAGVLGVYLHSLAGERAASALGKSAVMATDVANNIRFQ
ncbi:MAG: NAD(P)H-hydrate dehydratase [Clostridia bacterium]|nr:NAD(P)H-hydrate dehydratase [Clostridia bacterium]